jgi:hypothetical protein
LPDVDAAERRAAAWAWLLIIIYEHRGRRERNKKEGQTKEEGCET